MWYVGWGGGGKASGEFDPLQMNAVTARGAMPVVTWMPWEGDLGPNQPAYALRTILAGTHDAYIRRWARAAAAWGRPFYLRFAHEMNGNWYPWSPGLNGNTSAEFVAAWRRIHDIFHQEGAANVRWVWSPNVLTAGAGPFTAMYPGDAYVDWVALGGYNFGPAQPFGVWQSLGQIFGHSYDQLTALTSRPVMIAETASTEAGGHKAAWITQGLLTDVPTRLPRVRAVIWFHENKEADWRINSSAAALAAFRQIAASATYGGRLP
jgi:beta-mannanase